MSGGSSNRGRGGGGGGGGSDSSTSSSTSSSFRHTANVMVNQAEQKIKDKFEELTPILTKSQLRNLDQHKYTASGVTLLDPLLQPFWNWLVLQMPLYVAPNLITLVGLAINVLTSTILMIQSPNADQHVTLSPLSSNFILNNIYLYIVTSMESTTLFSRPNCLSIPGRH